jgi:hypothetical protein
VRCAEALGVHITLQPGDPSAQMQRFDAHHDGEEADGTAKGKTGGLVISYFSPRFLYVACPRRRRADGIPSGRGNGE